MPEADESTQVGYGHRTIQSIEAQCAARGIPPEEVESVRAHVREESGKPIEEMNESELRRLNRNLPNLMVDYLGGKKRRGGPADPWANPPAEGGGAAAAGGGSHIDVAEEDL